MIHVTKESIKQALKEKVITKREAQELIAALAFPAKRLLERKNTVGPIRR